jgi:hypothetical protein
MSNTFATTFKRATIPNFRLEAAYRGIQMMLDADIPVKVFHAVIRTKPRLEKALQEFAQDREKLAIPFAVLDDDGNLVPDERGMVQWRDEEAQEAFKKAEVEFMSEEREVEYYSVNFATAFPNPNEKSRLGRVVADLDFMFEGLYDDVPAEAEEAPKPRRRRARPGPKKTNSRASRRRKSREEEGD